MDMKDLRKLRKEQTEEALLDRIDEILDEEEIKDCWKAIWYAHQCCKETA